MDTLSGVKCLKFVGVLPQPSPHKGHQALYRAEGHPAKSAMPGWQAALPLHLCDIDKGSEGEYVGHFFQFLEGFCRYLLLGLRPNLRLINQHTI